MTKVILDTSFILSCIREKIDFGDELLNMGLQVVVPLQVVGEIQGVADSEKKLKDREIARLALKIIDAQKFEKLDLGKGHVDKSLINYAEQHKDILVATLDKEIKKAMANSVVVIRAKKKLEIV